MVDQRWFDVAYIVNLLGVHPDTVREWLRDGRLQGRNFGGRTGWRISETALTDFLNADEGKAAA